MGLDAKRREDPADWLNPEELNERIALAIAALEHAHGLITDMAVMGPTPKARGDVLARIEAGLSALTGPSKG